VPLIAWTEDAWEEYLSWQRDKQTLKRVNALLKDICRNPFKGIGKPEPLRFDLAGYWSRRISEEHRLVYRYDEEQNIVYVIQCKSHY
jgi:toxin YoeB